MWHTPPTPGGFSVPTRHLMALSHRSLSQKAKQNISSSVLHQQANSSIFAFHSTQGFTRSAPSLVFILPHDHSQQKWMKRISSKKNGSIFVERFVANSGPVTVRKCNRSREKGTLSARGRCRGHGRLVEVHFSRVEKRKKATRPQWL